MRTQYIHVDEHSRIPKYKQIIESVMRNISEGVFTKGERIPSINKVSEECLLSRDTVEKAYNFLKKENIINSVKGKGYYVTRTDFYKKANVLFLVDHLSSENTRLFNGFVRKVDDEVSVDLDVYHSDEAKFCELLRNKHHLYTDILCILKFKNSGNSPTQLKSRTKSLINSIDPEKLIFLESKPYDFEVNCKSILHDDVRDLKRTLNASLELKKYQNLQLVLSSRMSHTCSLEQVFNDFCRKHSFEGKIVESISDHQLEKNTLYIVLSDEELLRIVRISARLNLELGEDIGVISCKESIITKSLNIKVVSCRYHSMGELAAHSILSARNSCLP